MILASRMKAIGDWLVSQSLLIKAYRQAMSEDDITAIVRDIGTEDAPFIIGILPSADALSLDSNKRRDVNFMFFYIFIPNDKFKDDELANWDLAGECADEIENILADNVDDPPFVEFRDIDWGSVHKDPEGAWGCKGYSISFQMMK
jgi:hypothetical protein